MKTGLSILNLTLAASFAGAIYFNNPLATVLAILYWIGFGLLLIGSIGLDAIPTESLKKRTIPIALAIPIDIALALFVGANGWVMTSLMLFVGIFIEYLFFEKVEERLNKEAEIDAFYVEQTRKAWERLNKDKNPL